MNYKKLQIVSFLVLLLVVFLVVLGIVKSFLILISLGIILATLFHPVYAWIFKKTKSANLAALSSVLLMLFIVFIPVFFFGRVLLSEGLNLYDHYKNGEIAVDKQAIIANLPERFQGVGEKLSLDLDQVISRVTGSAFSTFSSLVSNITSFLVAFVLLLFTVYYLLRDGEHIIAVVEDISPIATSQENVLIKKIASAVNGVVKGQFLVALIQGFVALIGFIIFGVPQPLLWSLFTIMAALIPTFGTSLALVPAIVYLFLTGNSSAGFGLLVWGILAVSTIDNFISPKLIGSKIKLHPLLVIFSIFGGIQFFGFLGFLIGPIIMAIFVALLDMYRTDFKEYLEQ